MIEDLPLLSTLIIALSWVVFLLYRTIRVPDRLTNRSNRYLTYIGVLVPVDVVAGTIGTEWRNNWAYFGSSITTQAVLYCLLAWYSLNFYSSSAKNNKFLVRPFAAIGLAATMIFEIICFSLAGPMDFNTISIANPLELNQSLWLMLSIISMMVYLLVNAVVLSLELRKGLEQGISLVFRYRCFLFLLISTLYGTWSFISIYSLLFYCGSGQQAIVNFSAGFCHLIQLILGAIYGIVLIFDKQAFTIFTSKIDPFFNRRKIKKLQWFYQHLMDLFPTETYLNPFNYTDPARESSPGWMLKVIVHELINFRILVLSTNSLLATGAPLDLSINPEKELPLWGDFFGTAEKIEMVKTLSHKISPAAAALPKSKTIGVEQETAFFLWLAGQLKKKI